MTLGSLFDGIGGFPLAAVRCGITPLWASEIEKFPIAVTKKRFPTMLHVGDITKLNGTELPPVDIITGGSPCQDLSVAGKRAGLAGARSGLFMEQIRLIKEMRAADEARHRCNGTAHAVRPRYMCWENVPGAFSSAEGEDFRAVLEETLRIADVNISVPRPPTGRWESAGAVLGDKFSLAWRVLDAQYWGVPQRRKRIFLVADFGGFSAPEILFEQDRLFGNPAAGEDSWKGTAAPAPGGAGNTDGADDDSTGCLNSWDTQQSRIFLPSGLAPTLASADGGGGRNPAGLVLSAGFCAGVAPSAGGIGWQQECAPTLKAAESGTNMVPSVLCLNDQNGMQDRLPLVLSTQQGGAEMGVGICPAITAAAGTSGNNQPVLFDVYGSCSGSHGQAEVEADSYCIAGNIVDRQDQNGGNGFGCQANISYTLNTADRHVVFTKSEQYQKAVGSLCRGDEKGIGNQYVSQDKCILESKLNIRRLTPLECERLQGYPDGWTDIPEASDSVRYKALGNSVAIPCVEFVMRGIAWFLSQMKGGR